MRFPVGDRRDRAHRPGTERRIVMRAAQGLGAASLAGAATLAYAGFIERNAYVLRRVEIPCLPAGHRPLRVVHVSDMHLLPRQEQRREFVRALASLGPDLVINTGDNIASTDAVPAALSALGPLLEVPGAFVFGSNDYFGPRWKNPAVYLGWPDREHERTRLPVEELRAGLRGGGWLDLNNASGSLHVAGSRIDLVGVDDPHLEYDDLDAVRAARDPAAVLKIGVTHAPYQRDLDAFAEDGCELIIAGHTHGGQLCLPVKGALVTNCDLDTSRVKGVSRWWPGAGTTPASEAPKGAAWLHVSAGLGTSPTAPARFACRPEASLLTLVPRPA